MATVGASTMPLSADKGPANVVPIGKTTTLTGDELNRIRTTLLHAEAKTQGQAILSEEDRLREKLRDMSKQRMSGWNNTLEARRRQKEAARQSKIDEEEKRRQVMDREEAAFQAAERKKAIQRANTLLYENTERVKAFGSKLYLSDVIKEREMQMVVQNSIKAREKEDERLWHERTMEAIRKGGEEEDRKKEEALQRALHGKQVQLDQLEEFRVRYVTQKRAEKREGELIMAKVEAHILEEKEQEARAKEEEKARAAKTLKDNRRLQEEKRIAEQQAREDEEKRIMFFAEEKERKMRLRAEREAEIAAHKQAIRQRMIDRQVAHLQSLRQNENERVAGQVREAEAKRDAEINEKNRKMQEQLQAIKQSHLSQLNAKAKAKVDSKIQGEADASQFQADYQAGLEADRAAEAARRQRRIELKHYHIKQARNRAAHQRLQNKDDEDEQELIRQKLLEEDLLFDKYTKALIEQYEAEGKPTKPLLIELAKMKAQGR
uniref:Trichohyalin-plectin-homology domain-containing protein n=1 Tax=Hemiselmis andersenii TaxID=464988 RepID=A0A6U4N8R6_HEMAN